MLLSVIVPVYNVEAFVGHCLSSILKTTAKSADFEVVVVNDGTTDDSMSVVRSVCAGYTNVRIHEQVNQGLSAARMHGMELARGEYVWFVDSDDWIEDDAVSSVLFRLEQMRPEVLITPLHWRFDEPEKDYSDIRISENKEYHGKDCLLKDITPAWAAQRFILKKQLFQRSTQLFFPLKTLHEDEYFGRVLLYSADSVYILKEALYNYRQRETSIMRSISIRNAYDLVKLHKLLKVFLESSVSHEDKLWFRRNIFGRVLLVSYYHLSFLFGKPEFNKFLSQNRKYIITEYFRTRPQKSLVKIIGDLAFLFSPYFYSKYKTTRYIE